MSVPSPTAVFAQPVPTAVRGSLRDTVSSLQGVSSKLEGISSNISIDVVTNGQEYTPAYAKGIGVPSIVEEAAGAFSAAPASIDAIKPFLTPEFAQQFGDGPTGAFREAAAGVRELTTASDANVVSSRASGFASGSRNFAQTVQGILDLANARGDA